MVIAWDHVQKVMLAYPQMFRTWLTKQTAGFVATTDSCRTLK
jgi:hypothetical protein